MIDVALESERGVPPSTTGAEMPTPTLAGPSRRSLDGADDHVDNYDAAPGETPAFDFSSFVAMYDGTFSQYIASSIGATLAMLIARKVLGGHMEVRHLLGERAELLLPNTS